MNKRRICYHHTDCGGVGYYANSLQFLQEARSDLLEERGLDRIKIIVGGAPFRFNPELYKVVQADTWARDGITASRVITDLIAEVKK